jgi:hypothetical protein
MSSPKKICRKRPGNARLAKKNRPSGYNLVTLGLKLSKRK